MVSPSRRRFLTTLAGASTLAGCSALSSRRSSIDLAIFSHLDEPHEVWLRLFRGDKQTSEAKVYDKTLSIEAEGEVEREDFVTNRQYEIRFTVYTSSDGRTTQQDHVHYYPVRGKEDPYIAFDLVKGGVMRMR